MAFQDRFSIFSNGNFIDLNLLQCGQEACRPAYSFGPARRTHFLFHYILSGSGTLMAEDHNGLAHTWQISSRQGFLLWPGQTATYTSDIKDPWTYIWVEFDGIHVRELLRGTTLDIDHPVYTAIRPEKRDEMLRQLQKIIEEAQSATPLLVIGRLYLFFGNLIESARLMQETEINSMADYYVQEAVVYIQQHYDQPLTVESIAASLRLDRSYFGKVFKRVMHISPQQFLIRFRMAKAVELLRNTPLSIREICEQTGYTSQLHFSRAFKEVFGMPPTEWRKLNKSVSSQVPKKNESIPGELAAKPE